MTLAPNTGTQDWQRGTVSAQKLLLASHTNIGPSVVGIPPNAETLVLVTSSTETGSPLISGVTTNFNYPVFKVPQSFFSLAGDSFYYCQVDSSLDSQMSIDWISPASKAYYVLTDAAARLVIDPAIASAFVTSTSIPHIGGIVAMGADGVSTYPLATDNAGRLRTAGPTLSVTATGTGSLLQILPAAVGNGYRLQGASLFNPTTGGAEGELVTLGGIVIEFFLTGAANTCEHVDLGGFETADRVNFFSTAGTTMLLRYETF